MEDLRRILLVILAFGFSYVARWIWIRSRRLPLPPGPKAREIDIAKLRVLPWVTFMEWGKTYGPIISYSLLGKPTIVLNSPKVISDLLESKSSIYSDRPVNYMAGEIAGRKWNVFSITTAHPRFKIYRRLLQSGLNPRACRDYRAIQVQETVVLLKALARRPEEWVFALRRTAVAVMLKLAYGFQIGGQDDDFVKLLEETMHMSMDLTTPGKYLVENLPILRFIPDWCPGANFKRHAKTVGRKLELMGLIPFQWTKRQIETGKYTESFISKLLHSETPYLNADEKEDVIKWCSSALYVGGGDTTVGVLTTFMLIMQLYPEVQRRAQADIDRVVPGRLPTFEDYESLPYISALIKELLRWGPVAPIGLPHCTTQDDVYGEYRIPKGTKILANIWAITHDEELYPDPYKFDPERHLGKSPQPDPFQFVFGFGRRSCPGAHFGEISLFLSISNILAVFNISKALDASGDEVEPPIEWLTSVTSHLKPFPCRITVRSPELLSTALEEEDPRPDSIQLDLS